MCQWQSTPISEAANITWHREEVCEEVCEEGVLKQGSPIRSMQSGPRDRGSRQMSTTCQGTCKRHRSDPRYRPHINRSAVGVHKRNKARGLLKTYRHHSTDRQFTLSTFVNPLCNVRKNKKGGQASMICYKPTAQIS